MTANEMRYGFLIQYDRLTNLQAPGYNDREISVLLTKAQLEYVKSRYAPKGNKYGQGFENSEKRRKDLSELVRNYTKNAFTGTATVQTGVLPNARFWLLPDDFMWSIEEHCKISVTTSCVMIEPSWVNVLVGTETVAVPNYTTRSGTVYKEVPIKPITHDQYISNVNNPLKNPTWEDEGLVWRLDFSRDLNISTTNKRHELICDDGWGVVEYTSRYIRKPDDIVVDTTTPANQVDCALDNMAHPEIIDIAVRIAAGITLPNEYQLKTAEQNKDE